MARFLLTNVRLSFPNVFEKGSYDGKETKYEATFLIPKSDTDTIAMIKKHAKTALLEKFGSADKIPKAITQPDKFCLRDGDGVDYDGYAGHWSFKASNKGRPCTLDRNKNPITPESGLLYAGCYVDASVEIWIQNNSGEKGGKRINANLFAVRHRKDGEPFGAGSVPAGVADDFEDLEEEELEELEVEEFDL